MDIYFKSVGRGTPLLLNIPPNKEGRFADADVAHLQEFRATLGQMYATSLLRVQQLLQALLVKESLVSSKPPNRW